MAENEIKYVVRDYSELEALLTSFGYKEISQGYLNPHNRIRSVTNPDTQEERYFFAYKQRLPNGHNLEIECPIENDLGKEAWEHTEDRLQKRRVSMTHHGCKWDIDFYRWPHGQYFVIAEVEMPPDMRHPEEILPYLVDHIAYEVPRDDGRFAARMLANEDHVRALARELNLLDEA